MSDNISLEITALDQLIEHQIAIIEGLKQALTKRIKTIETETSLLHEMSAAIISLRGLRETRFRKRALLRRIESGELVDNGGGYSNVIVMRPNSVESAL